MQFLESSGSTLKFTSHAQLYPPMVFTHWCIQSLTGEHSSTSKSEKITFFERFHTFFTSSGNRTDQCCISPAASEGLFLPLCFLATTLESSETVTFTANVRLKSAISQIEKWEDKKTRQARHSSLWLKRSYPGRTFCLHLDNIHHHTYRLTTRGC